MIATGGAAAPTRGGILAVLALFVLAAPAAGQQEAAADRGWIGVGIRQGVRCEAGGAAAGGRGSENAPADCRPLVIAEAVIQGGPADRAGVQPGDTLIAVNGRALLRRSGQDELLSFEEGEPAQLLLGRDDGRVSVRVVPERRPPEAGRAPVWVEAGGTAGTPAVVRPRVLVNPDQPAKEPGGLDTGEGSSGVAVFRLGEDGEVYVESRVGDSVRLRRLEAVAPRIREIRDSVFSLARVQLQAVRKHQREALTRVMEARREQLREEVGEAVEAMPRIRADAPMPMPPNRKLRMAGAEFRPLSPPLAEYFPGAEHGLLVLQVVPGTPAAELGLRSGDVVVSAGDRRITGATDLREALSRYPRRDSVVMKWVRKGEEMTGVLKHE